MPFLGGLAPPHPVSWLHAELGCPRSYRHQPATGLPPWPEHTVGEGVIESWVDEAREFGIASIICLIGGDQLWLYRRVAPEGLVERYRSAGFDVCHIPTADQQTHPFTVDEYEHAWESFQRLPKPVLVHCSAGMDRTGRVVQLHPRTDEGSWLRPDRQGGRQPTGLLVTSLPSPATASESTEMSAARSIE